MTTLTTGTKLTSSKELGAKTKASNTSNRLILLCVGVAFIALLVWLFGGFSSGMKENILLDRIPVEPHSFAIALKEKGELQASHSTDIKCEVEGRSTIISLIPEGTPVKKGDLLVELASDEIKDRIRQEELKEANAITVYESAKTELDIQRDKNKSDIRKADLEIQLKQIALEKYQKGDWTQRSKDATIAIEQAEMNLARRKDDYEAKKKLYDKNYTTKTDYEEAEFNFKKAEWDLEKAKHALMVLEDYTHKADLMQRQSDLEEAKKEYDRTVKNADAEEIKKVRQLEGKKKELELIQDQLTKFRAQKEKCRIYSPTQGFVVYYTGGGRRWFMGSDQQVKEGAEVIERQILMQLPDTSEMRVTVRVHEAKTNQLAIGQRALITIEGFPGKQFTGSVNKIAAVADSQSSWLNPDLKEYETEVALDPTDVVLKPGVTAHVEILVSTVDNKLAVPVQAIFSKGGSRYVFRDSGKEPEAVKVELGGIGTEWAQIKSGVNQGENIYLAFNEEMKRLIPDVKRDQNGKWDGMRKGGSPGGKGPGGKTGAGPKRGMKKGPRPSGGSHAEMDKSDNSGHDKPAAVDTKLPASGTK